MQSLYNRFRSWPTQMTSPSHQHRQARVQQGNTYNHTYMNFFAWTKQNNRTLNPDKRTCTLFTPDPAEYKNNLDLRINNTALRMAKHPKVLGLTLDPKLTYSTHIYNISVQVHKPLQMIKSLKATGWGKQKETLMATNKAVTRPTLEFASSIWSPLVSSTSINKPQVMHNAALRTATGCTQHLHGKTLILPIHEHLQFHVYFILQHSKAKNTIFNNGCYIINISTDFYIITIIDMKTNMRHIHTSIVSRHLATRGNNKIQRIPPLQISISEEILPRLTCRTLAQHR